MSAVPAKPTASFYPDTSTLSYAAGARGANPSKGDLAIAAAITEVSRRANLCLTYTHAMELTRGGLAAGMPEVDMLDPLETVWLLQHYRAERRELRNLLIGTCQGVVKRPALPSVPSFLSQFEDLPVGAAADFMAQRSLRAVLLAATADVGHRQRLEEMAAAGRMHSERLFADRQRAQRDGVTPEQFEAKMDENFVASIRTVALEVHDELQVNHEPQYVSQRGSILAPPSRETALSALPSIAEVPRLLPTHFILNQAVRGAGTVVARKASLSSNYFEQRGGDLFDLGHLVGAAYCEGFCCDKRTAEQLGDARNAIGLSPPIVFVGDKELLAEQILASVK